MIKNVGEEGYIPIENAIGIQELRHLHDAQGLNKALNHDEFIAIMSVYLACSNRMEARGKELGLL